MIQNVIVMGGTLFRLLMWRTYQIFAEPMMNESETLLNLSQDTIPPKQT